MKDPTKAVREMYVSGLQSIIPVFDGLAPLAAGDIYAVITQTSFTRRPIKRVNSFDFQVTLEIYQEFNEYGNSEGVDAISDAVLQILIPMETKFHLLIDGFSHDEVLLVSGANDTGTVKAFSTYRKTLVINHVICEQ